MTVRIGVISDTHLTNPAGLSQRISQVFAGVDHILHAGDLVTTAVIHELEKIAPVSAVRGNMDYPEVKTQLPLKTVHDVEGLRIGLLHGHGVSGDILSRHDLNALRSYLLSQFDEPVDCIVYGHTHWADNEQQQGVLFFNPGTATGRGARATVGMLTVDGTTISGEIIDV
ncbi:MAG: metallophosphoesterase [Chloroflexi bacterium]|nr:MAG: metallophosphoesterase [Chloroflexota bacterium]